MSGAVSFSAAGGRPPLRASASPSSLSGYKVGTGTVVTSGPCTVTVVGGAPPYTYTWTDVSNPDTITETLPASSFTYWRKTLTSTPDLASGTFKCVVEDSLGATVDSNTITVDLFNF